MNSGIMHTPTLKLFAFLFKLGIITEFHQKKHSFSYSMNLITPQKIVPKDNWIPLAIVSLNQEFIELIPATRRNP